MTYKTDALEQYKAQSGKRLDRENEIKKEITSLQKRIADKQKQYTNALRQDDDAGANKLLEDISKDKIELQFKSDKLNMQGSGEDDVKGEKADKALIEYHSNVDTFNNYLATAEQELEDIRNQYITKVKAIRKLSQDFQQVHLKYKDILLSSKSKTDRVITSNRNYVINPTKYSINHIE